MEEMRKIDGIIRQDVLQRREMRNTVDFFLLTDEKFIDNFRLNKKLCRNLLDALFPHLPHNTHPSSISGETKVFTALSFYATGSYQRTIGNSFTLSMSQQSPSNCIHQVCDYNLRILSINPRHAGATPDSFIWRLSRVKAEMERCYNEGDRNSWLLGDSGYPLQPWLMIPFHNAAPNSPEDRFNQRHAAARNCIERRNGVLKTRFRCLLHERTLRYDPEFVGQIIIACAVLHNMCVAANLEPPHNTEPENGRLAGPQLPPFPQQQNIMEEGRAGEDIQEEEERGEELPNPPNQIGFFWRVTVVRVTVIERYLPHHCPTLGNVLVIDAS
ncbi:hypothetical protein NQ315_016266 [Exocentrus adspersus]|uniref:DDE Tnp4 domain-containing protein n=1 Tax=Exocentrus adspersus TaxID=1586481 RepID=A0AAV8VCP0_9CUCU|nr:hypothetical protein NQ315_016266 [Exocentrus adspersus]